MEKLQDCPLCEEGKLHPQIGENEVEYLGHVAVLPLHYAVCDYCGSELGTAEMVRLNKQLMLNFKASIFG